MDRKTSSEESHEDFAEEMHEPTASERVAMQMHRGDDDDSSFSDDVPDTSPRDYDAASSSARRRRKKKKKTERSRATEIRAMNSTSSASSVEEGDSEPSAAVIDVLNNSNEENTNELNPRDDLDQGRRIAAPGDLQNSAEATGLTDSTVASVAALVVYPGAFAIDGPGRTHDGSSYSQSTTEIDHAASIDRDESTTASRSILPEAELVDNNGRTLLRESVLRLQEELQQRESVQPAIQAQVIVPEESENANDNHRQCMPNESRRKSWLLVALAFVFVATGVVLGAVFGQSNSAPTELPIPGPALTPLPTPAPISPLKNLIVSVSLDGGASLEDDSSPQSRALSWLEGNTSLNDSDWQKVQRYVLATLYYSTNGAEWDNSTGWLSDENECEWYYNSDCDPCENDGRNVDTICLYENGLKGTIPQELALLSNSLEDLRLYGNKITGSLPTEIGLLSGLKYLWFGNNQITGSLPTEIGLLSELNSTFLGRNQITGSLPTEIGLLFKLDQLTLRINQITGTILTEIGMLTNITLLRLERNALHGTIPRMFESMPNLDQLHLNGNNFTGEYECPSLIEHCYISCYDYPNTDGPCRSL